MNLSSLIPKYNIEVLDKYSPITNKEITTLVGEKTDLLFDFSCSVISKLVGYDGKVLVVLSRESSKVVTNTITLYGGKTEEDLQGLVDFIEYREFRTADIDAYAYIVFPDLYLNAPDNVVDLYKDLGEICKEKKGIFVTFPIKQLALDVLKTGKGLSFSPTEGSPVPSDRSDSVLTFYPSSEDNDESFMINIYKSRLYDFHFSDKKSLWVDSMTFSDFV